MTSDNVDTDGARLAVWATALTAAYLTIPQRGGVNRVMMA